jgi:orotidine 5'-phosphate decarboxylase subfamily 2
MAVGDRPGERPMDRLRRRIALLGVPLCLGIDPHPSMLPDGLPPTVQGIETFARGVIEAAVEHAVAVKANSAFFEAFGSAGIAALERVRRDVPRQVFFLLDAKRGDIGSTAERYAEAVFGVLDADGVTVSPYLGEDAVEPFLAHAGHVVYVLARTSNPSAGRLQDLDVGGTPVYEQVARWVAGRWPEERVCLVVGATAPDELRRLRAVVPAPGFLVPGVGAQGGDLDAAVEACHGTAAPGLVAMSRGIAGASRGADWRIAAAAAAASAAGRMREVGATLDAR